MTEKPNTDPLEIAWTGAQTYVVGSPSTGDDDETNDAYNVDLGTSPPTCTCDHGEHNKTETAMCRHIFRAIMAAEEAPDMNARAVEALHSALRSTMTAKAGGGGGSDSTVTHTGDDGDNASTDDWDGHSVREMDDPEPEHDDLADAVREKFVGFAGAIGFDPEIVAAEPVEYRDDGQVKEGIKVEADPFGSGYWSDGEWQDKEGYDAEREKFKEVCKGRDAVQWFGDPDYANVLSIQDARELIE